MYQLLNFLLISRNPPKKKNRHLYLISARAQFFFKKFTLDNFYFCTANNWDMLRNKIY